MAKKNKKIPVYKGGGKFGENLGNIGATILDTGASALGMSNVADRLYRGDSANIYKGVGDTLGGVAGAAAPMVMNAVIPGSGGIVSGGQMALGQVDNAISRNNQAIDPQTGKPYTQTGMSQMGAGLGQMGGAITSMAMARNGGIFIKPENRGKFTASANAAGMGVQEFANKVLANKEDYSSTQVKRANFAHNAAGWKHEMGGTMQFANGGQLPSMYTPYQAGQPSNFQIGENTNYLNNQSLTPSIGMQNKVDYTGNGNFTSTPFLGLNTTPTTVANPNMMAATGRFANGGSMQYAEGGINAEVELDENTDRGKQFNGPSHANGGIDTHLGNGEKVLSARINWDGKSAADHNKPYARAINKAMKNLKNPKIGSIEKQTNDSILSIARGLSNKIYNKQEEVKQDMFAKSVTRKAKSLGLNVDTNNVIAALGGTYNNHFGNGGTKGGPRKINRAAYQADFDRFDKVGPKETESFSSTNEFNSPYYNQNIASNMKTAGYIENRDIDKYPVFTKDGSTLIRHNNSGSYIDIGDFKNLKYDGDAILNNSAQPILQNNPNPSTLPPKVGNGYNMGTPTPIAAPRKPLQFGPNMNYDPNTGQAFTGATAGSGTIIPNQTIQVKKYGGVMKLTNGTSRGGFNPNLFEDENELSLDNGRNEFDSSQYDQGQNYNRIKNSYGLLSDTDYENLKSNVNFSPNITDQDYSQEAPFDMTRNIPSEPVGAAVGNDAMGYSDNSKKVNIKDGNNGNKVNWGNVAGQAALGIGQNIGNLYDLYRSRNADTQSYERVNPSYTNNAATIRSINESAGNMDRRSKDASMGSGSAYRNYLMDNMLKKNQAIMQSNENTANVNAQIGNQAKQYNAQTQRIESDANLANQAQARNLRASGLSNIGQNVMGQAKDYNQGQMDERTLQMILKQYPNFKYTR